MSCDCVELVLSSFITLIKKYDTGGKIFQPILLKYCPRAFGKWLQWSRGKHAGLWYLSSRVQTQLKPLDFSGEKILSTPSFRGEVKPLVPCRKFTACKRTQK